MAQLPKRALGRTGLQVTMLGYGAMELRGAPRGREVTEAQSETILHTALGAGINYIDTSIDYGLSEERIGRYISNRRYRTSRTMSRWACSTSFRSRTRPWSGSTSRSSPPPPSRERASLGAVAEGKAR